MYVDMDDYTEENRQQTTRKIREQIRQRKRTEKKTKRKKAQRKTAGAAILLLTVFICKAFVAFGESDVTFALIPFLVCLTLLFVKDTAAEN